MMATAPAPITAPPRTRRRHHYTADDLATIRDLTLRGVSGGQIAKQFHNTRSAISKIQRLQLGLNPRGIQDLLRENAAPKPPKPKKLQTQFNVQLRVADARTLAEWHKTVSNFGTLDFFLAEILTVSLADYRAKLLSANGTEAPPPSGSDEKIEVVTQDIWRTKLTPQTVERIRRLLAQGVSVATIAAGAGVSVATIARIRDRKARRTQ